MSDEIKITISGDALAVLPRLNDDAGLARVIGKTMAYQNQLTVAQIQSGHLSGPTGNNSLSVRTNRLRGSVRATDPLNVGSGIVSSIGSNVVYAAIHEFGGQIKRTVKPGSVRLRTDKAGNLLRQPGGRLAIFARQVRGWRHKQFKVVQYAGGGTYTIKIPERRPFRSGIDDRANEYGAAVSQAILDFWGGKQA